MTISLIANSGIQLHKFSFKIDPNAEVLPTMGFYEFLDQANDTIFLQYAYYIPDMDIWVPKRILKEEGFLDENDRLREDLNPNILRSFALKEDVDFYPVSDIMGCLRDVEDNQVKPIYEDVWIPLPYFKKNNNNKSQFGPIAWARVYLKDITPRNERVKTYKAVLAFDTKVVDNPSVYYTPRTIDTLDEDNFFALSGNEDLNLNFCDRDYKCDWVESYIKRIYNSRTPKSDVPEFPYLRYLAKYLYLINYLEGLKVFPELTLYSDKQKAIDVDLVLDIGNSNTCGLLFESPMRSNEPFNFKNVKKLILNDLTDPTKDYDQPFSMRLAFAKSQFGELNTPDHKCFQWPSILRLGQEASNLINKYNLDTDKGIETATHHSSPKRYLWDNNRADVQWEFVNFKAKNLKEAIYYEGITEQFKENGDYAYDGEFACSPNYSRKSLMTFVYIEIILHAIAQVNSHDFRIEHEGSIDMPRKLKRITITCPTSIIQREQVLLRECAVEAILTLSRFFSASFLGQVEIESANELDLEVIPSPKDLAKNLNFLSHRKDWIYDEATCSQLVFLYGEISQRYLNNAEVFFNLYGKKRNDVTNPEQKSLTIGSIDIGGGTTDLMICSYQYEKGQSHAVVKPHPLYWESFNMAGDDLLKEIVQQIILEGTPSSLEERGCKGVIETYAKDNGVSDISGKMNHYFGPDSNRQGYMARLYRKNFIVQVAVPIALRYLQHAIDNKQDETVDFDKMFQDYKPNKELINHFNKHFDPIKFEDIKWTLSQKRVNEIVENTFDPMLKRLSAILSAYGCDFVLLAGKPTTIPKIREMFIKYYPVSPERIISLNNYRVGLWYPFADNHGYFKDPKTIVSVGAIIATMGGKMDKLDGFRINTQLLKRNLISTADYIGLFNPQTQCIDEVFMSPDNNTYELEIHTLPMTLGYKQLPNSHYQGRSIYKLDFNDNALREKVLETNSLLADEREIENAIGQQRKNLESRMPFRVRIKRDWNSSKEHLIVDSIKDNGRNELSKKNLALDIITLSDKEGYWLDKGMFVLNIK